MTCKGGTVDQYKHVDSVYVNFLETEQVCLFSSIMNTFLSTLCVYLFETVYHCCHSHEVSFNVTLSYTTLRNRYDEISNQKKSRPPFRGQVCTLHTRNSYNVIDTFKFHALMGRFKLQLIYFYYLFFHRLPIQ